MFDGNQIDEDSISSIEYVNITAFLFLCKKEAIMLYYTKI